MPYMVKIAQLMIPQPPWGRKYRYFCDPSSRFRERERVLLYKASSFVQKDLFTYSMKHDLYVTYFFKAYNYNSVRQEIMRPSAAFL